MAKLFGSTPAAPAPKVMPIPDPEGAKSAMRQSGAYRKGARKSTMMTALNGGAKLGG